MRNQVRSAFFFASGSSHLQCAEGEYFRREIVIWICEVNSEFQGRHEFGDEDTDGYLFLHTIDHSR